MARKPRETPGDFAVPAMLALAGTHARAIIAFAGAFSAAPPPGLPPPAPVVDVATAFQKLLLAASGVLYEDTYLQARRHPRGRAGLSLRAVTNPAFSRP